MVGLRPQPAGERDLRLARQTPLAHVPVVEELGFTAFAAQADRGAPERIPLQEVDVQREERTSATASWTGTPTSGR